MSDETGLDDVDPLDLVVAARSRRKTWRELTRIVSGTVPLVWRSGRALFVALLSLQVVTALALAGQVLAIRSVLEAILALDDHDGLTRELWAPVMVFAGLTALASVARAVHVHLQRLLGERVTRFMWGDVLDVATRVSLRHFESPAFYNRLDRVQTNALTRPYQVSEGLFAIAGALAAGVGLAAALVSIHALLLPLVVLGGLPLLLTSRRESRLEFEHAVRQTPTLRLIQYLTTLQTGRAEAKEVRAFAIGGWLRDRFDATYASHLDELSRHLRRRALLSVIGSLASALILAATMVVLVQLITGGLVTVAGAGAALVAVRMLSGQVQGVFSGVQRLFEAGLFLDDLSQFMALGAAASRLEAGAEAPDRFRTVTADRVTFTYPGSSTPAVARVSVELNAGEVVALVGENGSGKTTLSKMLAGLYEPDHGAVRWDGVDVRSFLPSSLRQRVAVVFQDFTRYAFSARDNISLAPGDDHDHRVREAATAAGANSMLERLPYGYETILSRLFAGGLELSGGQWQRVAIARAFYRDAPLLILDEPSASLDPRAEHALFSSLRAVLRGRTALFVSHRLSAVRGADRIYLLDAGAVVESGTHDELIALGGRYAEMFALQADTFVSQDPTIRPDGSPS
jgi:ATP-binding cassette subfamily B protein